MLLRLAIVEDEDFFQKQLTNQLILWEHQTGNRVNILTYSSGKHFLLAWQDDIQFDGIFLDIRLPNEDGIEIAKTIRHINHDIPIVFVTSVAERVFQGYDVQALQYLLKPIQNHEISGCLNKIMNHAKKQKVDCYVLRTEGIWRRIPYHEIIYVESFSHYLEIYTNDETLRIRKNLTEILEEFPPEFVRCYRSCIVNIRHVNIIRAKEVVLSNKKSIPLSNTYVVDINRHFIKYHEL
jgi:DNA-binding LytR/AlgR family response regulator